MGKQHVDVGFQPDLADYLQTLRMMNRSAVIPLEGNMEIYVRDDPEFGPTVVQRSKVNKIKSERVKAVNKRMRECAAEIKGKKFSSRAELRKAMKACLQGV